jgi:hypothetical protein
MGCYHQCVGTEEGLIDEIVRRILTASRPTRVILFGSGGAGAMTRDSDIRKAIGASLGPAP